MRIFQIRDKEEMLAMHAAHGMQLYISSINLATTYIKCFPLQSFLLNG